MLEQVRDLLDSMFLNSDRLETYNNTLNFKLDEIENPKQVDELRAFTYAIDREKRAIEQKLYKVFKIIWKYQNKNLKQRDYN